MLFSTEDIGREVKIVMVTGDRARGTVCAVTDTNVEIESGKHEPRRVIAFSGISTVTRVGDFS